MGLDTWTYNDASITGSTHHLYKIKPWYSTFTCLIYFHLFWDDQLFRFSFFEKCQIQKSVIIKDIKNTSMGIPSLYFFDATADNLFHRMAPSIIQNVRCFNLPTSANFRLYM